eukprot:sb/3478944/
MQVLGGSNTTIATVVGEVPQPISTAGVIGDGILDVVQGGGGAIVPEEVKILMRELYHPLLVETFNIGPVDIGMLEHQVNRPNQEILVSDWLITSHVT